MIKNFFKVTVRNLLKSKVYSFINIFGLAIGIASFLLIALFVKDELTYDRFNKNADRIFRINSHYKVGDSRFNMANSPAPLASVLKDEYPEVKESVRLIRTENTYIKKDDEFLKEEKFYYADSSLFKIFSFEFINGNAESALKEPNSIVLTEKSSKKYFVNKNPLGERIILADGKEFLVTGIINSFPNNSHFEPDFIASFSTLPESRDANWFGGVFVHTYVLTDPGVTDKLLNAKIFSVAEKYLGPIVKGAFGMSYQDFLNSGNDISFEFVPLSSIHLYSEVFNELKETGDINTVYMFSAIALFILLIACINFINLATARSSKRANEVGVRKVLGSNKAQLVKQFLSESIMLSFIAVVIAILLVAAALPQFNALTQKELSMRYFDNLYTIPAIIFFTFFLGIAAGIYPSIMLASYKPVSVLKGKIFRNTKKSGLRRALVVFQFATSIILFIGTFVIYNQMEYMKNKNLGFDKDQVLVIKNVTDLGSQQFAFVNSIKENSKVLNASLSQGLPSYDLSANIYRKEGESSENHTLVTLMVDYNYFDTYKLQMKSGRFFSKENSTDTLGIILNESAVKKMKYDDPINAKLLFNMNDGDNSPKFTVIGVVKDFNIQSLKEEIRPAALVVLRRPTATFLSVKLSTNEIQNSIEFLSEKWKEFGQSKPLEYSFFDENFEETYRSEIQAGKVFTSFAVLAIVIASLGLFGLAAFTAEQRTKEIGIRKVLGSSIPQIIMLLSQEFMKWVLISNILAWPVAYYIMHRWLEDFVYRININLIYFALAGLITLMIAILTVSYQSIKAAFSNPINSLRYE